MGIEDEDFDILAGDEGRDEGAADAIAELDTDDDEAEAEQEPGTDDTTAETDVDDGSADDTADGSTQEQSGGQTVPLAVLLDERKSFQTRMDDLAAKAAKFEAFEARMKEIQAEKDKPEPEPEPEYLDDPKAFVEHKVAQAEKKAEEADNKVTEMRQMTEQQQQMQQINNRLNTFDAEYVKQSPDYYDALEYVRNVNIENIKAMGADEQTAGTQAAQAMFMAQAQAMHKGVNPAEMMYNMAKRFGYSTPAPADEDPGKAQDEKDDAIIAGQDAASMGGGAAPDAEHDEELDDDEFAETFKEMFGQAPR